MTNFFYNDEFYSELEDLLNYLEIDEDNVHLLKDDYTLDVEYGEQEPMHQFDINDIVAAIDYDRYPENDYDWLIDKINKAIKESVDFEKLNSLMPKLWYTGNKKETFTKAQIIEYLK